MTTATGPFPFAFVFDARGRLVLAAASGSANTYRVLPSGALSPAGTAAANGQEATCWLVEARHYFYATNTASDTIVAPDGALTLTATVHGLPAYDGSNGMEGIVAT